MRTILLAAACCFAALSGRPAGVRAAEEQLRPRWRIGEQWVVETTARPAQSADELPAAPPRPVSWHFTVGKVEKVAGHPCFRLDVRPEVEGGKAPLTTLWVDEKTMVVRQVQAQLLVQGALRDVTERYEFDGGASPVFAPLTALPLELPVFTAAKARGPALSYRAVSGEPGARAPGDLDFAVAVRQQVAPAAPEDVKRLLPGASARDPKARLFEVKLAGPERRARQLWQPGLPWPVYSDNGHAEARLVKVIPP